MAELKPQFVVGDTVYDPYEDVGKRRMRRVTGISLVYRTEDVITGKAVNYSEERLKKID